MLFESCPCFRIFKLLESLVELLPADPHGNGAIHHNEASVGIQCKTAGYLSSLQGPPLMRLLRPRLRIVSIIPGIEMGAPERTDTRRGSFGSPSFFPTSFSSFARFFFTSSSRPAGGTFSRFCKRGHILSSDGKTAGTGNPIACHFCKPCSLSTKELFHRPVTSAFPPPKKYQIYSYPSKILLQKLLNMFDLIIFSLLNLRSKSKTKKPLCQST